MTKHEVLKKYFGYPAFREGQEQLIDAILSGRDVLGIMPTGAGKSMCYQIPALLLPGITLVISPLISLMKDQVQALNQAGIHAAYINSSLSENQIFTALQRAAAGQYKIIYVAPERLGTAGFLAFVRQAEISMLTVDEAHCISQWGQDFRPSYLKIVDFLTYLEKRPIVSAFTATATEHVKEDIACVLRLEAPEILVTGFDRKNLYFAVETPRKKDRYITDYITEHKGESGVIYCATRKNVDSVYELLRAGGVLVTKYHAGLSGEERRANQEDFIYDKAPVMVATNAFGMGIDKSNVRYVIHYNMPQSLENYYQEAGRAGRDGEAAECILLYSAQDVMINRFLLESKETNTEFDAEEMADIRERDEERLRTMTYYCMTKNCLRAYILHYFGEQTTGGCGNCANCNTEFIQTDVTEAAGKIVSCVAEARGRYGINVIAGTLAGDNRAKLREYGVASYQSYGALKEMSEVRIKQIINQLLMEEILCLTKDKYALLKLTPQAGAVKEGTRTVILKESKRAAEEEHATGKRNSAAAKTRRSDLLNTKGLELFEHLRNLRTRIAREQNMPPYIIFSDRTLTDMCVRQPFTKEEMLCVSGVGESKFEKYGEAFLQAVRDFTGGVREKYCFGEPGEVPAGGEQTAGQTKEQDFYLPAEHTKPPKAAKTVRKQDFYLMPEQAARFPYAEKYLAAELAEKLNELRDAQTVKKISGAEIYRKIQAKELAGEHFKDGMRRKYVTDAGERAGIFIGMRTSKTGSEYEDFYFDQKAQQMVVDWVVHP